jgi:hypothetical protein
MRKEEKAKIQAKAVESRTTEDIEILKLHDDRRIKKNENNKKRNKGTKGEAKRILAKVSWQRTANENEFIDAYHDRITRKNHVDKLRRMRLRHGDRDYLKLEPPALSSGARSPLATTPAELAKHQQNVDLPNHEPDPCTSISILVPDPPATPPSSSRLHFTQWITPSSDTTNNDGDARMPHHHFPPVLAPAANNVGARQYYEALLNEAEVLATTRAYHANAAIQAHLQQNYFQQNHARSAVIHGWLEDQLYR